MKNIIVTRGLLTAALLLTTSVSSAQGLNLQNVASRVCDGVAQSPSSGERVVIVESHSLIGLTQLSTDGCVLINFHTYITKSFETVNDKKLSQVEVVPGMTLQKSSCSNHLKEVPEQFTTAELDGNKLTLFGGAQCKKLELVLK